MPVGSPMISAGVRVTSGISSRVREARVEAEGNTGEGTD